MSRRLDFGSHGGDRDRVAHGGRYLRTDDRRRPIEFRGQNAEPLRPRAELKAPGPSQQAVECTPDTVGRSGFAGHLEH